MAPKKLTDADKQAILALYRQPEETTSTLAERYSVSNSTISRVLKSKLPEAEYTDLIQQKRQIGATAGDGAGATPGQRKRSRPVTPDPVPADPVPTPADPVPAAEIPSDPTPTSPVTSPPTSTVESPKEAPKRRRRRTRPTSDETEEATTEAAQLTLDQVEPAATPTAPVEEPEAADEGQDSDEENGPDLAAAWANEDLDADNDWDDSDDDEDDDEDDSDEDDSDGDDAPSPHLQTVEINPLTADVLSGPCYLVVERSSAELVVLPLRIFADLGQIPDAESEARTLAVFDNHRVARRFSRRNQRVIKVPNSDIIHATRPYLQAKGITRLLVDGQVYAIGEADDAPAVEDAGVPS